MPKIKSNSTSKGRFKISGTGKILFKHTGKNHGMTKRRKQQIRDKRKQGEMTGGSKTIFKKFLVYFKKLRKQ